VATAVPPFVRWLLRLVAGAEHRAALLSDLDEEAAARAASTGIAAARRWSTGQVLGSVRPLLARRLEVAWTRRRRTTMRWVGFGSDVQVAARRLREAPAFTLVAMLTVALGIGGNAAVFTLIDRVLLEPLPVQRPSELVRLGAGDNCCVNSGLQGSFSLFSYDLYAHLRDAAPSLAPVAAFQASPRPVTLARPGDRGPSAPLSSAFVSGNYFQLFELAPVAGRLLQPADDARGAPAVAVLSHRAWLRRFGARPDVVGAAVTLNGVAATIVGVAPKGFYGETLRPDPAEIWIPLSNEPALQPAARLREAKGLHWLYVMGRVRSDVARTPIEMTLTATLRHWLPANADLPPAERSDIGRQRVIVAPAAAGVAHVRDGVAPALRLLQLLALAVLLLACANLATLLLVRGTARRAEIGVRVALGGSRLRLAGQALLESVLLAGAGGVAGLGVAALGARGIVDLAFRGATDVPVNPWPSPFVVGVACAASLLTGIVFGTAPAIIGSRADPIDALRGASRTTGERGGRLRWTLVTAQIAVSLVLVACAGLLGRSLHRLEAQDFGFAVEGRYVASLASSLTTVDPVELPSLYTRMQEALEQIPGVTNAAFSLYAPMSGDNWSTEIVVERSTGIEQVNASWNRVSPRYFDATGTPLLRGRAFDERDRAGSPLVALVSQSFARRHFGDLDPIGRRIGQAVPEITIIGVVGDAKYRDGRLAPRDMFFLPFLQETAASRARAATMGIKLDRSHYPQAIELHTRGAVANLEMTVRRVLAEVDPRIPVRGVIAMDEQVARQFAMDRLVARLTMAFGGLALLLACLGLYGVTAYALTRRTREIGLRMAIGATRAQVVSTMLRGAVVQLMVGAALGLPAAFAAGELLRARLFGVEPTDPWVLTSALGVLAVAAGIAALLPASRAAGLDPVQALRRD
jgi:macrolide transport system ATP-binding/permease protein